MKWLCVIVLILALLFLIFIWNDTPMEPEAGGLLPKSEVTESPSYWHWLDEHYPREFTAHYLPTLTPSSTPVDTLGG